MSSWLNGWCVTSPPLAIVVQYFSSFACTTAATKAFPSNNHNHVLGDRYHRALRLMTSVVAGPISSSRRVNLYSGRLRLLTDSPAQLLLIIAKVAPAQCSYFIAYCSAVLVLLPGKEMLVGSISSGSNISISISISSLKCPSCNLHGCCQPSQYNPFSCYHCCCCKLLLSKVPADSSLLG